MIYVNLHPQEILLRVVLQHLGAVCEVGGERSEREAARSAAERASEVRVSAPIELRQGSGGAAPGKFLRFLRIIYLKQALLAIENIFRSFFLTT